MRYRSVMTRHITVQLGNNHQHTQHKKQNKTLNK